RVRALDDDAFPVVVAHRGASATHPENTLPAFEAALAAGAPLVELDVRLSADGVPVVVHDPEVSRTTDGAGWVHELTLEDLRSLNAGTADRPAQIPTLDEVLRAVSGRGGVAHEIKNVPGEPPFHRGRPPARAGGSDRVPHHPGAGPGRGARSRPRRGPRVRPPQRGRPAEGRRAVRAPRALGGRSGGDVDG